MAHLSLLQIRVRLLCLSRQVPVRRKQQQQILPLTMFLPHLKDRLLPRHIISSVTIEQQQSLEAMRDEILQQPTQQIQIDPWFRGQGSREVHVMMGIPQPLQRRKKAPSLRVPPPYVVKSLPSASSP